MEIILALSENPVFFTVANGAYIVPQKVSGGAFDDLMINAYSPSLLLMGRSTSGLVPCKTMKHIFGVYSADDLPPKHCMLFET